MHPKDADRMANSVDPDQNALSDLDLHCLSRPVYPNTEDYYSKPHPLSHVMRKPAFALCEQQRR